MVGELSEEIKKNLEKYTKELNLSNHVYDIGCEILDSKEKKGRVNGYPQDLAAGIIYISAILAGEKRTQKEICKIAEISPAAAREGYKKMRENIDVDIILQ